MENTNKITKEQLETIVNSNPTIQTVHDVKDQVASIFGVLEDYNLK